MAVTSYFDTATEGMMNKHHFIFFIKGETTVAQSLEDVDTGEIIKCVLMQYFNILRCILFHQIIRRR